MKTISEFRTQTFDFLFTDIDDTLTNEGQLEPEAYAALWKLMRAGIHVVPVTGRPAGWCEMIARFWPVAGVVGENGGLYFRYHGKKMLRHFDVDSKQQEKNRQKLELIKTEVLKEIPGVAIASDQFCRLLDLAVDFAEDVPPQPLEVAEKIVSIFEKHGAQAKISSIHVNGWFGHYNKLSMCKEFLKREFSYSLDQKKSACTFVGDSPNDEPMFEYFPTSFAVSNIKTFASRLKSLPTFVASHEGGKGFSEIADAILK